MTFSCDSCSCRRFCLSFLSSSPLPADGRSRAIGGACRHRRGPFPRPLISEAIFPKDDLYVTAFIAAAVLALAREPMRDRLGPWRVGVAMGMVLASKYTVLLACPIFLFLVDSPFKAQWKFRHWLIAQTGLVALLAASPGTSATFSYSTTRFIRLTSISLASLCTASSPPNTINSSARLAGIWDMLADRYHSLPTALDCRP